MSAYFIIAAIFIAMGVYLFALCRWWYGYLIALADRHDIAERRRRGAKIFACPSDCGRTNALCNSWLSASFPEGWSFHSDCIRLLDCARDDLVSSRSFETSGFRIWKTETIIRLTA